MFSDGIEKDRGMRNINLRHSGVFIVTLDIFSI